MSYRTQLCRCSDYLPVWILFVLILTDIINYFIVRQWRIILFLLMNLDTFFLNRYLAFFNNAEMPFFVN